jgi:hypothetical protein
MQGAKLIDLSKFSIQDAYLAMQLMQKLLILPLTKQLSNLAGNLWSRSLSGARAERIEYLLLHEFRLKKLLMPDKRKDDDEKDSNNNNNKASTNKNSNNNKAKTPAAPAAAAAGDEIDLEEEDAAAEPLLPAQAGGAAKKKWKKKNKPAYEGGKGANLSCVWFFSSERLSFLSAGAKERLLRQVHSAARLSVAVPLDRARVQHLLHHRPKVRPLSSISLT